MKKYGLFLGEYRLANIPAQYPVAIVGAAVEGGQLRISPDGTVVNMPNVTYTGDQNKKRTRDVNGRKTDFYYGEITVTVTGDFGNDLSLMSFQGSYMGGQNVSFY